MFFISGSIINYVLQLQHLKIKEENTIHNKNEFSLLKSKKITYFLCPKQGLLLKLKIRYVRQSAFILYTTSFVLLPPNKLQEGLYLHWDRFREDSKSSQISIPLKLNYICKNREGGGCALSDFFPPPAGAFLLQTCTFLKELVGSGQTLACVTSVSF